jgi:ribosomal protein S18 acetylase RimI-like enzyme
MDAEQVYVRTYQDSDSDAVAALWSVVFPNDPPWNEPILFIRRKRSMQPELFWVAQQGDQIIGTVVAGYDGVRRWIYHLAVHPYKRRRGTAGFLMQEAERALKALGCPKINLQVRTDNTRAIDFYTLLGYEAEERVSMGKPLDHDRTGQEVLQRGLDAFSGLIPRGLDARELKRPKRNKFLVET